MLPEFSIIIPTYNRVATLSRAIESALQQTFPAKDIIVVDDGSTDNTADLVMKYPNVRYCYQVNQGVSSARNRGADEAAADWLIFLDSDDELDEGGLVAFKEEIQSNCELKIFQAGFEKVNKEKRLPSLPKKEHYLPTLSGSYVIKKTLFKEIGGFDPRLNFSENTELFHRLNVRDIKIGLVSKVTLRYYDNILGGSRDRRKMTDSLLLILDKHDQTLTERVKWLYLQIIGVNFLRFGEYQNARLYLWKALTYNRIQWHTLLRLILAYIPFLAKLIYPVSSRK